MRKLRLIAVLMCAVVLSACGGSQKTQAPAEASTQMEQAPAEEVKEEKAPETEEVPKEEETATAWDGFHIRFASAEEGRELMFSNEAFFANMTQNDIEYRMQKKGATLEEYKDFAAEQVREFSQEEQAVIQEHVEALEKICKDEGYQLPYIEEIFFIKTTMEEEGGAAAYTHGTQIYVGDWLLELLMSEEEEIARFGTSTIAHELFHCFTRCDSSFRAKMYGILNFTVEEDDFVFSEEIQKVVVSNPDVEHHNAHATFRINGEDKECVVVYASKKDFEKAGDDVFEVSRTCLVPIDTLSTLYEVEEAENFYEVFGRNTGYVIDPEETLADNFSYALVYGIDGMGYENPEIIEEIIALLKTG